MILKIRTMISGEPSWTIISDVCNVSYRRINKETRQDKKFCPDFYVMALDKIGKVDETMQDYIYVTAMGEKPDKYITICSNMVVYLLNDEGKTIERIN